MLDLLKRIVLILVSPIIMIAVTIGMLVSMVLALPCLLEFHDFEEDELKTKKVCKWCGKTEYYMTKIPENVLERGQKNND